MKQVLKAMDLRAQKRCNIIILCCIDSISYDLQNRSDSPINEPEEEVEVEEEIEKFDLFETLGNALRP